MFNISHNVRWLIRLWSFLAEVVDLRKAGRRKPRRHRGKQERLQKNKGGKGRKGKKGKKEKRGRKKQ